MPPAIVENSGWPEWLAPYIAWMTHNHLGDVASIAGVLISIIGFLVTLIQLTRSRRAAEAAKIAAVTTRQSLAYIGAISDFASAIEILEEIKRYHRSGMIQPLPDRYMALRKILVTARAGHGDMPGLTTDQLTIIQSALLNLSKAEELIDRTLSSKQPDAVDFPRLNRILSKDIDQLQIVLTHLKSLAGSR
jgi:hypothetical protein